MAPPKFGLALSFQVHQASASRGTNPTAKALSSPPKRTDWASTRSGPASITARPTATAPSPIVACAALAVAAPNCRIGQAVALAPFARPSVASRRGSVGARQSLGRPVSRSAWGRAIAPPSSRCSAGPMPGGRPPSRSRSISSASPGAASASTMRAASYKVKGGLLRPPPVRPGPLPLWIGAAAPLARARAVRHRAGLLVAPLIELEHLVRQIRFVRRRGPAPGCRPACRMR